MNSFTEPYEPMNPMDYDERDPRDSEATTAGAARQSMEGERCPKCGALPVEPGAYTYDWACKSSKRISGYVEESALCLRRQLAQAHQDRDTALVREARLRLMLEAVRDAPKRAQAWMRGEGIVLDDPDDRMQKAVFTLYGDLVELSDKAEVALASSPANPYAAVVEAARELAVTLYEHNEKALQRYRMENLGEHADLEDDEGECCDICCAVSDLLYDLGQKLGAIGIDDLSKIPDLRDLAKLPPEQRSEAIHRLNEGAGIVDALANLPGRKDGEAK